MSLRPTTMALALAVALSALFSGAGCATTEALRGLPPFFELESSEVDDATDVVLRPLFRYRDQPHFTEGAVTDRTDVHYLFPLGHWKQRGGDVEHHLWPIFHWIRRRDPDGFESYDYLFFPLVWGGHDPVEGTYFSLLPFGGTFKSLFAKDYILHVLFPLFAYTRLGTFETYHLLFPLFAYQTGRGNEGFRIMPFYGHQRKVHPTTGELISDRYSVLFPLFSWAKDNINTRNPFSAFVIFPFYGQTRSRWVDETSVLWPFFRKRDEKQDGIVRWRVPFPFVMLASGNETQYDFWPFGGYRARGGFRRWFFLWPLIRDERYERDDVVERRRWFLPFVWLFRHTDRETGKPVYEQDKIWPVAKFDRSANGAYSLAVPSLLWFTDSPQGNFERILTPVLEVFRFEHHPEKGNKLKLLFGTFTAKWDAGEDEDGWSVLGGLFGYRTTREGDGRVRLLYFVEI